MSKRIYTFVNIRYFIFISVCSGVFSVTKIKKYSLVTSLSERQCLASNIVFEEKNIVSATECLKFCSRQASCAGISYRQSAQECIGCNEQLLFSNVSDAFETSLFYRQDECPSENGRIQLDINFRLKIYMAQKNQSEAELDCERELNGRLAIFDEEWKINAIENLLLSCVGYDQSDYWIDGAIKDISSDWKFIDERNIPMSQIVFWHQNKPDSGFQGRVCLRLKYSEGTGYRFDDRICRIQYPYICEY